MVQPSSRSEMTPSTFLCASPVSLAMIGIISSCIFCVNRLSNDRVGAFFLLYLSARHCSGVQSLKPCEQQWHSQDFFSAGVLSQFFSAGVLSQNWNYFAKLQFSFLILYIKRYKIRSKSQEKQKFLSLFIVFSEKILIIKKNVIIL